MSPPTLSSSDRSLPVWMRPSLHSTITSVNVPPMSNAMRSMRCWVKATSVSERFGSGLRQLDAQRLGLFQQQHREAGHRQVDHAAVGGIADGAAPG